MPMNTTNKTTSPIHKLNTTIHNVECWNFTTNQTFTLNEGLYFRLCHATDSTKYIISIVHPDSKDDYDTKDRDGIMLTYTDKFTNKTYNQKGYRFIIDTKTLNEAANLDLPLKTYDHITAIINYENGELSDDEYIELFQYLYDSGVINGLQGSYQKAMRGLVQNGFIKEA
jgi:hypothetical protein